MNKESVSILSVLVNAVIGLAKALIGLLINSSALLADGIHSITDFISSLGVYIGIKVSKKPVDEKHPYGYYAAETVSGLMVVFLLVFSAILIVFNGLKSILDKETVQLSLIGFVVVIISIILVESMARLKFKYGRQEESLALIADAQHSRADVFSSLGVLAGLILTPYFIYADGIMAVAIGLYILKESFGLGREVVDNLLGVRDEKTEQAIRNYCQEKNIELVSLKSQKIGSATLAEATIKLEARLRVEEAEVISKKMQEELIKNIKNLEYLLIQIESHKVKQGFIRSKWGGGKSFHKKFVSLGLEKKGYRIVIPFKDGKPCDDFGSSEYLIIDKEDNEILEKQTVENPYFEKGRGFGMRFVKSIDPDEIIVKKIGSNAQQKLKELVLS